MTNNNIVFFIFLLWGLGCFAQEGLKFNEKGEFKILQLTDIHWSADSTYTNESKAVINSLIKKEAPDLIVLTGDIVNRTPMAVGWEEIASIVEKFKIPWTVTFGNHDDEHDFSRLQSFNYLKKFSYFVGEKGNVSGVGNFTLNIIGKEGKPSAVLYFMDSHAYTGNSVLGSYDWIKTEQINWYVNTSNSIANLYNKKLPSLMFFHIPLQEYNLAMKSETSIGDKKEEVSASEINSGLFSALVQQKDVMGTFCGHDHNNNFIGMYKNIALAYGNKTGKDGYGDLDLGGRVILLKEGKFIFDTYITTLYGEKYPFKYPFGYSEITEETPLLKAMKVNPKNSGIVCHYYEGKIKSTKEIERLKPLRKSIASKINLDLPHAQDHFALKYSGYIQIPETAYYKFYTYSDDGSVLKIDGKIIIDNDGGHSARRKEGVVALEKGFHKIEVDYFEDYMGQTLYVGFSSISIPEKILDKELFH